MRSRVTREAYSLGETMFRPADGAVQYGRLLVVGLSKTEPTPTREFIARTHQFLELIKPRLWSRSREVVPMDTEEYLQVRVGEHAGRGSTLRETHRQESARALILPSFGCFLGTVHVLAQQCARPRRGPDLVGELDVSRLVRVRLRIEVHPRNVEKQ